MAKKIAISFRVSPQILDWFRAAGPKGYQSLMHDVLERYVQEQRREKERQAGRAQEMFRQYYARCFWHYHPDLEITSSNVDLVIEGLRKYGGREGLRAAEELCR